MEDEQKFTEGFNDGFVISIYQPSFRKVLFSSTPLSNSYLLGIQAGIEVAEKQQSQERTDELRKLRKDSSKELDR
jgi:hypothetical protein